MENRNNRLIFLAFLTLASLPFFWHSEAPKASRANSQIAELPPTPSAAPTTKVASPKSDLPSPTHRAPAQASIPSVPPIEKSPYRDLEELTGLKAINKTQFHQGVGEEVSRQSGYVIFRSSAGLGSLTHFDGIRLPVVREPGRNHMGIVDGQLIVKFKTFPSDLEEFSARLQLQVIHQAPQLKMAFLTPMHFPANLIEIMEELKSAPEVESSELSILYGNRRMN